MKILKYTFLALTLALINLGFLSLILGQKIYAATPGCYEASGLADRPNYQRVDCSSEFLEQQLRLDNTCLIRSANGGTFRSADCSSFEVGVNNSSPAETVGDSNRTSPADGRGTQTNDCKGTPLTRDNCGIIRYTVAAINFLSAVAGLSIVASVIFAGYLYMTARDNAGQIQKAKQRIVWAAVALFLFIFMYAFLNWLVPGGVLP